MEPKYWLRRQDYNPLLLFSSILKRLLFINSRRKSQRLHNFPVTFSAVKAIFFLLFYNRYINLLFQYNLKKLNKTLSLNTHFYCINYNISKL